MLGCFRWENRALFFGSSFMFPAKEVPPHSQPPAVEVPPGGTLVTPHDPVPTRRHHPESTADTRVPLGGDPSVGRARRVTSRVHHYGATVLDVPECRLSTLRPRPFFFC